jgi:hypothetical protein
MYRTLCALFVCLLIAAAQVPTATLSGTITDPSGASTPDALVQLRGAGGEYRARTDATGKYTIGSIQPGKYLVRVIAKGFSVTEKQDLDISGTTTFDAQLVIEAETQVVNVEAEANKVTVDPGQNGGALVLGQKELATLSDDPDELEQQLQAMAGPSAGPSGGQIYIDGFTGSNLPPKSSIREVRINSNPFSPEYDRPGFGRIEIFTKPGTDTIRGQAFFQFNNQELNSRSPLLAQSDRPPYEQKFFGLNLTGPVKKQKASFGLDFERRNIDENAFVLATALDSNLNPQTVNQAILTPQVRTNISPRIDYSINEKNTLTVRYQNTRSEFDKEGVGNYNLASQAYNQKSSENTIQMTETSILSAKAINEARFQYMRTSLANYGDNSVPAIIVQGAFSGGGAQIGNSSTVNNRWEASNSTTYTHGTHSFKWGARLRHVDLNDTSLSNFGGTYTFFGGTGPELDANSQAIAGTSMDLSALERYRRTLLFRSLGYSAATIRALGGGASQFSLNAGTPSLAVNQLDAGLFINDDWRLRPNLTLSYGLRYEVQTNIGDHGDWSPRLGLAWGVDGRGGKSAKTVVRVGFGTFYDRIGESTILASERYNGVTQQSYLILNPDTYPVIPTVSSLASGQLPQQLQPIYSGIAAPRNYQWSAGVDRQVNRYVRFSANYIGSRGTHLAVTRNINTPIDGVYPFGDQQIRLLTESTGVSRTNMLILSPSVNYKKLFLFGFYGLSHGMTDAEGQPSNPYNLRAEWGPSAFADVRHRMVLGTNLPLPWRLNVSPFMMVSSGSPYNITTGRDTLGTGVTTQRPALVSGLSGSQCQGGSLLYEAGFGCFDLNPAAGTPTIGRNYARGPANLSLNMRLSRTWSFGSRGESGVEGGGPPPGMGGMRGGGPGGGGPPAGGPPPGGGGPGGPGGMFGSSSGMKYNLTLSLSARNILNHPSYSAPSGDLSSPYFGQYRSLAGFGPFGGNTTYDRKIDVQLRFQF